MGEFAIDKYLRMEVRRLRRPCKDATAANCLPSIIQFSLLIQPHAPCNVCTHSVGKWNTEPQSNFKYQSG